MNKLHKLMILLLLVGVGSAAVYVTTNPEAQLYFSRDSPGPEVLPVISMIECGDGWSNSCGIGVMDGNALDKWMFHKNTQSEVFNGIVYFEIECEEGLVDDTNGIKDFSSIIFTDPHNNSYQCDSNSCIERLSPNLIRIMPTTDVFAFESGTCVYTNIRIDFIDYAYGNYVLTAYVDKVKLVE